MSWTGVDLDGTLAHYEGWGNGSIGKPVLAMVRRVKKWLADGDDVRIFTARVSIDDQTALGEQVAMIEVWCLEHLGQLLPITCKKDFGMGELWDDRCIQVEMNTGQRVDHADWQERHD